MKVLFVLSLFFASFKSLSLEVIEVNEELIVGDNYSVDNALIKLKEDISTKLIEDVSFIIESKEVLINGEYESNVKFLKGSIVRFDNEVVKIDKMKGYSVIKYKANAYIDDKVGSKLASLNLENVKLKKLLNEKTGNKRAGFNI
ncbi:hypothetical protein N9R79_11840, partial [Vibrio sp.]|nr:hypothetical protein [Vibrio sp.]